jgi:hypothetical protein
MVGAPRFELGTSWSRTKRATRLRHAPNDPPLVASDLRRTRATLPVSLITRHSSGFKQSLVGTAGFEPATTCTPSKCATRLRYVPAIRAFTLKNGLNGTNSTLASSGNYCQDSLKLALDGFDLIIIEAG